MAYNPSTDLLALLRQTSGGVRTARMPGLDYIVAALARAGLFNLAVQTTAPTTNQSTTVWAAPASPNSWASEASVFLWNANTGAYAAATPALWAALLAAGASAQAVQDVTTAGPVAILPGAGVVRVQAVGASVILTMPLSAAKIGPVLISDWANAAGTNNIRVNLSGADVFPGGATFWTIDADTASIFARPVPGGYAL